MFFNLLCYYMRKVAFVKDHVTIFKLMILESKDGTYLFGYDNLADTSCIWDEWYATVQEAKERTAEEFDVSTEDWIEISDPCPTCQHDLITHTSVTSNTEKLLTFKGLSGNERLYITGLMNEFDEALKVNKHKAIKILQALKFDEESIMQIV